jgi:hypothetical protein
MMVVVAGLPLHPALVLFNRAGEPLLAIFAKVGMIAFNHR